VEHHGLPLPWRAFAAQGIEPTFFLYRHYDADGDLLYVGMSTTRKRAPVYTENLVRIDRGGIT